MQEEPLNAQKEDLLMEDPAGTMKRVAQRKRAAKKPH